MSVSKKLLVVLGALLTLPALAQDSGLARVTKIQGVETYLLCEPLREYDNVFDEKTGLKAASLITGGLVNEGISDKASQFVRRVLKEALERNIKVDAVVYSGGKNVIAVRFKGEGTDKTRGIGRVKKINGLEAYVMSEPLREYEVTNQQSGGLRMKSYITGGLVNNSIEEDMERFVSRVADDARKSNRPLDAVLYSSGKSAVGIKFK